MNAKIWYILLRVVATLTPQVFLLFTNYDTLIQKKIFVFTNSLYLYKQLHIDLILNVIEGESHLIVDSKVLSGFCLVSLCFGLVLFCSSSSVFPVLVCFHGF